MNIIVICFQSKSYEIIIIMEPRSFNNNEGLFQSIISEDTMDQTCVLQWKITIKLMYTIKIAYLFCV